MTLLIQNGRILDIGKPAPVLKSMFPSAEVIDAHGKVIVPGFVDAHHSGESFILRYITSDYPSVKRSKNAALQHAYEFLKTKATYDDFLKLYRLSYYAALRSGVTTISEYGMDTSLHSFAASLEAMRQANVRGFIGVHNSDQIETALKMQQSAVRFALVIEDEENLTTYSMQSTLRTAQTLHWPIILHVGKDRRAYEIVKKNFAKSITQLFQEHRVFEQQVQLIHLACLEPADYGVLAKTGIPLVFSPSALLQSDMDRLPFNELLKHGIPLALCSDWGAAHPIENIRALAAILGVYGAAQISPFDLLALQTKNGAAALGLGTEIGSIEIGKKADLVFLDLADFRLNGVLDGENAGRVLHIILEEAPSQLVSDVMINGEFYVRAGHVLTYSEDDLAADGHAILKTLTTALAGQISSAQTAAPVFPLQTHARRKQDRKTDDTVLEEGFRMARKDSVPGAEMKSEQSTSMSPKLPDNVRKIFGDDDV
jgi:5-methylthioadenosine/S-adenosylhomocysteine deaminase